MSHPKVTRIQVLKSVGDASHDFVFKLKGLMPNESGKEIV